MYDDIQYLRQPWIPLVPERPAESLIQIDENVSFED